MDDNISVYDVSSLKESFQSIRKPRWHKAIRGPSAEIEVTIPLKLIPVTVRFPKSTWRAVTSGMRYAFATWEWLRPDDPRFELASLPYLQKDVGLDHVDRQTFANQLIENCKEIARVHPRLSRWIESRIAALDYWADPPKQADQGLTDIAIALRNGLWRAYYLVWHEAERGESMVNEVLKQAMQAAAFAVAQALGTKGDRGVCANLMVPFSQFDRFLPSDNWMKATELWEGLDVSRRLVIVAETEGSNHSGFWIPLTHGEYDDVLPGAPTAYTYLKGDAVFKDDLPPLRGFGRMINARWKSYMADCFRQRLFISVPFCAPHRVGGHVVPAVLNVNVDANDLSHWKRAYHPEWLAVAGERAQPFVEIAMSAWLIILNTKAPNTRLDTGSEDWDTLPTVGPNLALGGHHGSEEDEDDTKRTIQKSP